MVSTDVFENVKHGYDIFLEMTMGLVQVFRTKRRKITMYEEAFDLRRTVLRATIESSRFLLQE